MLYMEDQGTEALPFQKSFLCGRLVEKKKRTKQNNTLKSEISHG